MTHEADLLQNGEKEAVLLEAVTAAPALHELVLERGAVEARYAAGQDLDVLERDRRRVPLDEARERVERRRERAVELDAALVGVEVDGCVGHECECEG